MTILPNDVLFLISTYLAPEEVARSSTVCKSWNTRLDAPLTWKKQCEIQNCTPAAAEIIEFFESFRSINVEGKFNSRIFSIIGGYDEERDVDYKKQIQKPFYVFNSCDWNRFFGQVQKVAFPPDIRRINNQPSPFFPGRTVGETQLLVYKPEKVENQTLSLDYCGKLAGKPKQGYAIPAKFSDIGTWNQGIPTGPSCWLHITIKPIPHSENKQPAVQEKAVAACKYELPQASDAICAAMAAVVKWNCDIYGHIDFSWIRTKTSYVVGTSRQGLHLVGKPLTAACGCSLYGVAALQKYPANDHP